MPQPCLFEDVLIGFPQPFVKLVCDDFRTHCVNTVGEPFMAPAGQYVFVEMLGLSEHFTAGSHEWLPYSVIPTFPKLIRKHQFAAGCDGVGNYRA